METQRTASFLDSNHLLLARDQDLFEVVGQRNLNRTAIATREIKQGEVIHNILPYSSKTNADFLQLFSVN
ncbi:hypothetical protein [Brasilonema bromeliae]|uniref:Uncharacterized protein n=1 Tax=Brasilonema bromeliae SPC951 TaxID=385972 RepID=A0ABX1P9M3_9CYAN|nr:hypothetical protein [Brasilonema bromeliae]NMG20356.1 hypothetical protein [Brasilonema bromeliae SPC951]